MSHTPGPWNVSSLRDTHLEVHTWDTAVVDGKATTETVIADVYGRKRLPNARLIAAAPDILEALKDAAYALDMSAAGGLREAAEALISVRAAIAKAEGKP